MAISTTRVLNILTGKLSMRKLLGRWVLASDQKRYRERLSQQFRINFLRVTLILNEDSIMRMRFGLTTNKTPLWPKSPKKVMASVYGMQ